MDDTNQNQQNQSQAGQTTEPKPEEQSETPVEHNTEPSTEATQEEASAPVESAPQAVAQEPTPQQPATESPKEDCGCPTINAADWDKKRTQIDKKFYKTFSPRLLFYPFSMAIDINRAKQGALKKGYKIPEQPMIMDTGGMFWSNVMIEVEGADEKDSSIVNLSGKEVYTKASKREWKEMKTDIDELKAELGSEPKELYIWYTACPKCISQKEVKSVYIAVV